MTLLVAQRFFKVANTFGARDEHALALPFWSKRRSGGAFLRPVVHLRYG